MLTALVSMRQKGKSTNLIEKKRKKGVILAIITCNLLDLENNLSKCGLYLYTYLRAWCDPARTIVRRKKKARTEAHCASLPKTFRESWAFSPQFIRPHGCSSSRRASNVLLHRQLHRRRPVTTAEDPEPSGGSAQGADHRTWSLRFPSEAPEDVAIG